MPNNKLNFGLELPIGCMALLVFLFDVALFIYLFERTKMYWAVNVSIFWSILVFGGKLSGVELASVPHPLKDFADKAKSKVLGPSQPHFPEEDEA